MARSSPSLVSIVELQCLKIKIIFGRHETNLLVGTLEIYVFRLGSHYMTSYDFQPIGHSCRARQGSFNEPKIDLIGPTELEL